MKYWLKQIVIGILAIALVFLMGFLTVMILYNFSGFKNEGNPLKEQMRGGIPYLDLQSQFFS